MEKAIDSLLHDKTRPSRILALGPEVADCVVAQAFTDPLVAATHWMAEIMVGARGGSTDSVRPIWHFRLTAADSSGSRTIRTSRQTAGRRRLLRLTRQPKPTCFRWDEHSQPIVLDRTRLDLPMTVKE